MIRGLRYALNVTRRTSQANKLGQVHGWPLVPQTEPSSRYNYPFELEEITREAWILSSKFRVRWVIPEVGTEIVVRRSAGWDEVVQVSERRVDNSE